MVAEFVTIFGPIALKEKAGHGSLTFWKLGTKNLRSHREEEQAFYLNKRRLSNNQSSNTSI